MLHEHSILCYCCCFNEEKPVAQGGRENKGDMKEVRDEVREQQTMCSEKKDAAM